jgi:hypothetical protein
VSEVRGVLERSLNVDLAPVRVHQDSQASRLVDEAGKGARAFAVGQDIYLGRNERATDVGLMAHEVAHVMQQRGTATIQRKSGDGAGDALEHEADQVSASVMRGEPATVTGRTPAHPQFSILGALVGAVTDVAGAALNFVRDHARLIPGYDMLGLIIGRDPITQQPVERNAVNVIRALMGLWPGGSLIFDALQRYGIIDTVGGWLQQQIATLASVAGGIRQSLDRFIGTLGLTDIADLGGVWDRARRIFSEPINQIIGFVRGLVTSVLGFIRDAVLRPLARLAQGTRGYDLLRAVLGEDPITHEPYPRTPENMIGGFMRLIGEEEKWRHLQESRAIPRVWAWFQAQLAVLLGFVRQVPALFMRAWQSLQISDLLDLSGAFGRMREIFGTFVAGFVSWAGATALQIMMFIFEALAPGAMPVLRRAMAVMRIIINDPIRFVGNLVRAGLKGFEQFRDHIRTHLISGLVGWLTGALTGAGLQLPERWDFRGILSLVLQILGLTWANIRTKLVRVMGETVVTVLERTFDIVLTLVRDGPAAAWEKILEQLSNLQEMVFGQIREWVIRTVVGQAVMRIVSMLNPAGAVIQAIIAIYNTIMFFRERLTQIVQVAESFFNSVAQIAAGAIGAAADRVEQTMGRLVPVVISFLARLIGLGGISDTIRNIVARIRAPIDRALDRVVDWIAAQARRLGRAVVSGARSLAARFTRWWTLRKNFRAGDGQAHSLFFAGQGASAVLKVQSEEMPFTAFLNRANVGTDTARITAKRDGLLIAARIDTEMRGAPRGTTEADEEERARVAARINAGLDELQPLTARLFGPPSIRSAAAAAYGGLRNGFGVSMTVAPLTSLNRPEGHGPTSAANDHFAALNERRESPGGASFYIKGHLLNEQLGGPGDWFNLVPLSRSGNAQHERRAESIVKRTVDLPSNVSYTVTPIFEPRDNTALESRIDASADSPDAKRVKKAIVEAEQFVPASLQIRGQLLDETGRTPRGTFLDSTVPNPVPRGLDTYYLSSSPAPVSVNLSASAAPQIMAGCPSITPAIAQSIVDNRPTGGYRTYAALVAAVPGVAPHVAALTNARNVRLFGS